MRGTQRWLLMLAALAAALVGCSWGTGQGSENPAERTEVVWAFWGDPEEVRINEEVIRRFEAAHPEITIKVRHEPWDNYFNTVAPSLQTDNPPDVLFLFNIPSYAKDGVLENIQPYIDRHKIDLQDYWPELLDTYRYEGDLYGLPRDNDTSVVYYNKAMFDAAGLAYPTTQTTWAEFETLLEALTHTEGDRVARYGLAMEQGKWRHWLWQTGHGVLDDNTNPSQCLLDEPDAIEAVEWFNSLIQRRLVLTGTALRNMGGDTGAFQAQQAAMIIQNASRIPAFNKTPDLDYALAPLPVRAGWRRAGQTGGAGYVIAANSQKKEAAWTFLKWLQGKEGQMAFAEQSGAMVPALRSVASAETILSLPPEGRTAFVLETESQAPPDGKFAEWNQLISEVIDPDMELIWTGNAEPATLLPATCRKVEKFLKERGYPK